MKTQLITCLLLATTTHAISASTKHALTIAEQQLQPIVSSLTPSPQMTTTDSTLTISYLAQNYKIHSTSMAGEISKEAHDELGPTFKGFVLKIRNQQRGEINQAVTPQTLHRPYWRTYLEVTPVKGTEEQLYWGLSYGSRTDTNLIQKIMGTIEGMKE